jgi:putative ABC transport system permease protein
MGAAISIFSVVDAVLLEPLPFPDPDRLVEIRTERGGEEALLSMRELEDLREASGGVFAGLAAYIPGGQYSLAGEAGPEKPPAILMTSNLFSVLGVPPALGTTWPEVYDRERSFGLVLSHDLWTRQFGASRELVGGTIALDASPFYTPAYEIHGVMPEEFDFPARTDLYRSIFINDAFPDLEDRESRTVVGVGRLASGVGLDRARNVAARISAELATRIPETNEGVRLVVRPLRDAYVAEIRPYLLVLLGAALLLLLSACANVANLVLTRTLGRESELALRAALGAGRGHLLMGLAAEGLVLAVGGTVLALALARFVTSTLDAAALGLPSWMHLEVDGSVLAFAVGIAVVTGLVVGLWPARAGLVRNLAGRLRQDARGATGGARHRRLREALVAAEVALSLTLLLGSALLGRTFLELTRTDPGLNPADLLTFQVPLPWSYPRAERLAFQEEVLRRLEERPAVASAASNANPPLTAVGQPDRAVLEVEGQTPGARAQNPYMNIQRVSPGYFTTVEIPVLEGRAFDGSLDRDSTLLTAMVSARLAHRLWPGESAVGKRLRRPGDGEPWWEVVGVAGNVRYDGLTDEGGFDVYLSSLQAVDGWAYMMVRTRGEAAELEEAVKETVWSVDPGQPVVDIRTMEDRIADTMGPQRLAAALFAAFAVASLALAAAGIFAVVSVLVRQRTAELGVRMALGADRARILRQVVGESLVPTLAGVGLGLAGGAAVAQAVQGLLYGVAPWDPLTFLAVPTGIVAVALLAAFLPALRAARLDPVEALWDR